MTPWLTIYLATITVASQDLVCPPRFRSGHWSGRLVRAKIVAMKTCHVSSCQIQWQNYDVFLNHDSDIFLRLEPTTLCCLKCHQHFDRKHLFGMIAIMAVAIKATHLLWKRVANGCICMHVSLQKVKDAHICVDMFNDNLKQRLTWNEHGQAICQQTSIWPAPLPTGTVIITSTLIGL